MSRHMARKKLLTVRMTHEEMREAAVLASRLGVGVSLLVRRLLIDARQPAAVEGLRRRIDRARAVAL